MAERGSSGSRPRRRDVHGVLLLDKPAGLTSNAALQEAKHLLAARKAGHTGSLDPIATGLLPLCFGEATKISQFLLDADKRYWTELTLGATTTTGDSEGEVLERREVTVSAADIESALAGFLGEIEQIPPMYSAIKRGGEPLYKLARQGIEVEREPRKVKVYDVKLLGLDPGGLARIEIACSRGFYVRAFAEDLGRVLGCGAHVSALRRLSVGAYRLEQAVTLEQLRQAPDPESRDVWLLAPDSALEHFPAVYLSRDAAYYLVRGQSVRADDLPRSGWVRMYTVEGSRFLGVGESQGDGRVAPKRLLASG